MHHLPSRYIPCDGRLTASAYFGPRSPHGERRGWFRSNTAAVHFNPRSPQGSDIDPDILQTSENNFNPRSPHRERLPRIGGQIPGHRFQSTLPVGGATEPQFIIDSYIEIFQSTLSVGGRPKKIHNRGDDSGFQSTLPTWGATDIGKRADTVRNISIHAPRMGSDFCWCFLCYCR